MTASPLRILILHSKYLSSASGENRVVEDEADLLGEAGHEVHVRAVAPDPSGPVQRVATAVSAIWSSDAVRETRALIGRHRIEVVHIHNLFPMISPAVVRAIGDQVPVVITLHNYRLMCLPANFLRDGLPCELCLGRIPWRGVVHRCYRDSALGSGVLATSLTLHRWLRTFERVSRFLAVSRFVKQKHVDAGIPAERILVKPNFTRPMPPRIGPGDYFLYLGRLAHEKGVDTLVRAWSTGAVRAPLIVAGDGPEDARLRRESPPGVDLRGHIAPAEAGRLLANARALLVPSRWFEAAPRTIIEAYAAGVPVVASSLGALPEIVREGFSGRLVPLDDANAWAETLATFDDAQSERLGRGARTLWRDQYSPEQGLEGLERAYREAIDGRAFV